MTLDELINELQKLRERIGPHVEVVVGDGCTLINVDDGRTASGELVAYISADYDHTREG